MLIFTSFHTISCPVSLGFHIKRWAIKFYIKCGNISSRSIQLKKISWCQVKKTEKKLKFSHFFKLAKNDNKNVFLKKFSSQKKIFWKNFPVKKIFFEIFFIFFILKFACWWPLKLKISTWQEAFVSSRKLSRDFFQNVRILKLARKFSIFFRKFWLFWKQCFQ